MRYRHNRLQQLRGFLYAAQSQSISRAAEQMSLSQPSVSLQIQALEKDLGVQLFERRGPKIRLTRDGEMLQELTSPLVEGLDALEDEFASRRHDVVHGSVSIAAGGSTLQYIMPPTIEKFVRDFPQIELRLHNVTGKKGMELLRCGEVDIAVGPLQEPPADIHFHPLVTYEPMLITAPDHALARRKRIGLKDIAAHPLILPPRDQSTYRLVELVFNEHALQHEVKLEVGGYDVIKTYVKLGLGISIVMGHCLTGDEQLFTASMKRYFPSRSYGLVMRRGRPLTPATQKFVHTLCPDFDPRSSLSTPRTRGGRGKANSQ